MNSALKGASTFECKVCKDLFRTTRELATHLRDSHQYSDAEHIAMRASECRQRELQATRTCKVCRSTFRTLEGLNAHFVAKHSGEKRGRM